MLLKGFKESTGEVEHFTIADCPILVSDMVVALVGKKGSYLLKLDTIVRGDEETGIYEGDKVYSGDVYQGVVIYAKGFFLQDLDSSLKKLSDVEHIQLKSGDVKSTKIACRSSNRTALLFSYRGRRFGLESLLFKKGEYLMVVGRSELIDPTDVLFYTGFARQSGEGIFFGELYQGGVVQLRDNIPIVKIDEEQIFELMED